MEVRGEPAEATNLLPPCGNHTQVVRLGSEGLNLLSHLASHGHKTFSVACTSCLLDPASQIIFQYQ